MSLITCQTKGCDRDAMFHGMGKHYCWACYSRWLLAYRYTRGDLGASEGKNNPQMALDFHSN